MDAQLSLMCNELILAVLDIFSICRILCCPLLFPVSGPSLKKIE